MTADPLLTPKAVERVDCRKLAEQFIYDWMVDPRYVADGELKIAAASRAIFTDALARTIEEAFAATAAHARRVEAVEGLLRSAVEMLRKHEHAATFEPDNPDSTGGSYEVCPECGQALGGGHYSSCAYAALLARIDAALQAARELTEPKGSHQ